MVSVVRTDCTAIMVFVGGTDCTAIMVFVEGRTVIFVNQQKYQYVIYINLCLRVIKEQFVIGFSRLGL
jgi:hypothetical protein